MSATSSGTQLRIGRLILIPAIITLAVTIVRLVGELQHWSRVLFNPQAGGGGSLAGITWLAPIFGIYFAVKLSRAGEGPTSWWRALGFALLGVLVVIGWAYLTPALHHPFSFQQRLLYVWAVFALAVLVMAPGWPALFKTLLAYGYAARLPVAIIMFFAIQGNWETHYDAGPPDLPAMGLGPKFLWLGFFPQLIFWVGFTIVAGMLFGTIATVLAHLFQPTSQPAL